MSRIFRRDPDLGTLLEDDVDKLAYLYDADQERGGLQFSSRLPDMSEQELG